jgi:hypothetical protein
LPDDLARSVRIASRSGMFHRQINAVGPIAATRVVDLYAGERKVNSQELPMSYVHVPMLELTVATARFLAPWRIFGCTRTSNFIEVTTFTCS